MPAASMASSRRGRKKSSGRRPWEWRVWHDGEDDNSNFADVSGSNILPTGRRRTATSAEPKPKICEIIGPSQTAGSQWEVEPLTNLPLPNPAYSSNADGDGDTIVVQGYGFGPNALESTIEAPTSALDQVSSVPSQYQIPQEERSESQDAMGIDEKQNELDASEAQVGINVSERQDACITEKQNELDIGVAEIQQHVGMGEKPADTITTKAKINIGISEEQPNRGLSENHCHININKKSHELDIARMANHLDINDEQAVAQIAELQNLARSGLSGAAYAMHPDHKPREYRSPHSPKTKPSFGEGADNNAALENAWSHGFPSIPNIPVGTVLNPN
ncbi:uncharacterized protein BP5553_01585 [Venustampulla echinocandica]|uniref:Uncharacterized protein n=1 Tax=Venustampulla echinocandica TaxID=2656787 RepID=A0A370U1F3_9HELO|nr:uncharacterized protein BP5553_01585 [Venustampulla echinocandica]RDL41606.1 hypothetical protein BP5553_01585 [Venustampulla echinocandica]